MSYGPIVSGSGCPHTLLQSGHSGIVRLMAFRQGGCFIALYFCRGFKGTVTLLERMLDCGSENLSGLVSTAHQLCLRSVDFQERNNRARSPT